MRDAKRFSNVLIGCARLHHQLYSELLSGVVLGRRSKGSSAPLRADPFRDFADFATASLDPQTELHLALPLPDIQHRLNNLTSLDRCYEQLHADLSDLERLLGQLHNHGPKPLKWVLNTWPVEQHDELRLSLTWLAKLGCILWYHPPAVR